MCGIKSIDEILSLSDRDYKAYVSNLLYKENSIYLIGELDDELLKIVETHPNDVAKLCRLNIIIFSQCEDEDIKNYNLAYNYNTLMISKIVSNDIEQSKSVFLEGLEFCKKNMLYEAGKSICRNILKLFNSSQIPLEEALKYLSQITVFYLSLEKYKDAIESLCTAAMYFADVSAFQSAYRAINDAQEIAKGKNLLSSQIRILETQGTVALYEGDLNCADNEFKKCFRLYKVSRGTPPFQLRANAALVKLQKKDYKSAQYIYKGLLKENSNPESGNQIKVNLLICYRELGDGKAIEDLLPQLEMELLQLRSELRIETRMILSKTYYSLKNIPKGTSHLSNACIEIQELLDKYQRLHYRRGVREKFMPRIRALLVNCMESGAADDILPILFFCSANALLDWFSLLEWIDLILKSETVPDILKAELLISKERLIQFGTPFMYGFMEKYDDPFEFADQNGKLDENIVNSFDYSLPWRKFNDITAQICQLSSCPKPFDGATVQNGISLLNRFQLNGTAFLFALTIEQGSLLIFVAEGNYIKVIIPADSSLPFIKGLHNYQHNQVSRSNFQAALENLKTKMAQEMTMIIDVLESAGIQELVFVPDQFTEGLPILPIFLEREKIREKIKKMNFTFRTCPAIKEKLAESLHLGKGVFILDSGDDLELVESEKFIINNSIKTSQLFEIDLNNQKVEFSEQPLISASYLHMATHSIPANMFTDPFFVSNSTEISKNGIWLESVQRESEKLELGLVVLNGCNTGTTSNQNYFKIFRTNEKVGLSSAFLLNRKCTVIATQWNEPEIIGFVFSSLFYKRLAEKPKPAQAFILTLVDFYELTKGKTIEIMEKNLSENVREERCKAIQNSPVTYPFRLTYILSMFQCHSLLAPL